uniref:Uncharacterized protein n=1 Tax=Panagrolaimus davidi TaxID=227884 RepID=A0A914PVW9_9BILA
MRTTTTGRRSPKFSPEITLTIPSLSLLSLSPTKYEKHNGVEKKATNANAIGNARYYDYDAMDEEVRILAEYEEKTNVAAAAATFVFSSAHEKAVKDKGNVFNCCFTSSKAENEDEVCGGKRQSNSATDDDSNFNMIIEEDPFYVAKVCIF